jgi:hypothetical protein
MSEPLSRGCALEQHEVQELLSIPSDLAGLAHIAAAMPTTLRISAVLNDVRAALASLTLQWTQRQFGKPLVLRLQIGKRHLPASDEDKYMSLTT